ncbi:MAG: nucleoside deaminase [Nitrospirota bacterium]|jgi:tRNA(Arg) A34 adenosine deaminase TadA
MMAHAIDACRRGIDAGQTPFACAIAQEGRLIAVAHNTVWRDVDITAHAEMMALRDACHALGRIDLSGCDLYTTCEPCPMCLAASHWARIGTVFFGATIADAQAAGFNELAVPAQELVTRGGSPMKVVGGVLHDECAALFEEWRRRPDARTY